MKICWFGDSEDVFKSKIGQVVLEKNAYELDAIHCILYSVHNDLLPLYCPFSLFFGNSRREYRTKNGLRVFFGGFIPK
jgi:hypothetical protein